jgi:hypothetical protein
MEELLALPVPRCWPIEAEPGQAGTGGGEENAGENAPRPVRDDDTLDSDPFLCSEPGLEDADIDGVAFSRDPDRESWLRIVIEGPGLPDSGYPESGEVAEEVAERIEFASPSTCLRLPGDKVHVDKASLGLEAGANLPCCR